MKQTKRVFNIIPVDLAKESDLIRFKNLIKINQDCGCWEWSGGTTKDGYGNFWFNGKTVRASRFSYTYYKGSIIDNLFVCHKCDNPKCVNPDHLFIANQKTNIADAIVKGRRKYSKHPSVDYYKRFKCRCEECKRLYSDYEKKRIIYRYKSCRVKFL